MVVQFEDILEDVGVFGPFQIRLFILVSLFETPAAWAMFLGVFTAAKPEWICPLDITMETNNSVHVTEPDYGNYTSNSCTQDNDICPGVIYVSDYTSIVMEWGLHCNQDHIPTLINTVQMLGVLIGACVTGQLADMFGRRIIFYIVYSLLLFISFISSFSNTWQLYAALRFFVGAFFGGTMVINFVLPLEFVGRKWRTFCGCIGFWAVGVMTMALLAYLIRDWRHLTMASSLGGIFLLLTWWFVPESPRWLVQKGRIKEAQAIINELAKCNKRPLPEESKLMLYSQTERTKQEQTNFTYYDLFRTPSLTKNTLIVLYAWFVSSAVYYGTSFSVGSLSGNRYLNFFLSGLVEIPALIFVVLVNNRLGRKKTIAALMSVAGVSCLAILFVDVAGKMEELPSLTTAFAMIGKCGISGGWAAAQVFSAEIFPTLMRNIGVGASSMSARIGGIVAPQIAYLTVLSTPLAYSIFGVLALICAILTIFLPETLQASLPDTVPKWEWCFCLRRNTCRISKKSTNSSLDTRVESFEDNKLLELSQNVTHTEQASESRESRPPLTNNINSHPTKNQCDLQV